MNLKQYMLIFAGGTAVAFVAWSLVLLNIDPISAGIPAVIIFFATLFAGLVGLFTTLGTFIRAKLHPNRDLEDIVTSSLRQGFFFAILIESVLFLASIDLLSVGAFLVLILLISGIEFLILSRKHGKKKPFLH